MMSSEKEELFMKKASQSSYQQPGNIDEYINRYKTQVEYGYDPVGYCQGLIDLLEELKELRKKS